MGVPKFFAWLLRNYKKKNFVFQKEKIALEPIDWLLIDTNCLIHPKCFEILAEEQKKENINFKSLQNKMMNHSIEYIEKIIKYVDPIKGIYIAIDGPVCCAKMKQQRQRRFRSVHDKKLFDKIKKKHNVPIPYYWNNSAISPGTKFMEKLNIKIINWINKFKKDNKIKIIYSSANVPGEGEHKLLDFIKKNKKSDFSYVTYGLDADLIFLMLVTNSDKVYLLREAQQFESNASKDQLNFVNMKIMKDCIYDTFKKEINIEIEKNRINCQLYLHYEQRCFRKFKLNAFTNTQKSEQKMIHNFQKKYGKPDDTVFVMGDYDKGDYHMKGKEPVICKKFRRIFRNAGYNTFLVNEFRTSKLCNCCNEELEKFLERPSQKPKLRKEGKTEICHGLLRCQSVKHKSEIFHNRDKNAVQNMLNIVKSVLNTGKRPQKFCREINS